MLLGLPYSARVALLVLLMLAAAGVDLARRGAGASRWREYAFVLAAGAAAAACGFAHDLVTAWLSPDYFVFGKGLPAEAVRESAALLGLKTGFSAGAIAGAVCLFVATRKSARPTLPVRSLAFQIWRPFVLSVLCSLLVPLFLSRWDPLSLSALLRETLGTARMEAFLRVWWIHVGTYAGLVAGVVWVCVDVVKMRKRLGAEC
jgi:hypothetical protein